MTTLDDEGRGASDPLLSLVVLAWENLALTKSCVASLRDHTDVPYELIIVDNGSSDEASSWATKAADTPVLHDVNLGFAPGMNSGLAVANGQVVVFINNDTQFPPGWASTLLDTFETHPDAGIVLPAVTGGANPVSVYEEPEDTIRTIDPFTALPSGVVYAMERNFTETIGGWDERYRLASREDLDLLFTTWVAGRSVILDARVLVEHVGNATATTMLDDRDEVWAENWDRFVDKWTDPNLSESFPQADPNLIVAARAAAVWLARWYALHEERKQLRRDLRRSRLDLRDAHARLKELEQAQEPRSMGARLRRWWQGRRTGR